MREFAVRLDAPVDARDRALRGRGRQPRLPARRDYPSTATACWWRSPSSARKRGHRPPRRGARRRRRGRAPRPPARRSGHRGARAHPRAARRSRPHAARPRDDDLREVQARAGARSSRPSSTCPSDRSTSCPSASAAREPPQLPEIAEPEIVRHYNRLSQAQLRPRHRLLPARLVHDEAQPEAARARRRAARQRAPAPAAGPRARAGRAAADVGAAGRAGRDRRPAARLAAAVAPARTASSPACCSPAPTTRTAASTRTKVLTPDTAHGTNPATVTMAGYEVVKVGTDDARRRRRRRPARQGRRRRRLPDAHQPEHARRCSTANIEEIAQIVHGVGATLYYDGANLNAVMGRTRPGDMGFDIVHFNLHKTFTQPHGGGGPGAGPIAVSRPHRAVPAAPAGRAQRRRHGAASTSTTTARSRSAACAASRATTASSCAPTPTSCSLGGDGLQEASETAVLNANYLLARLQARRAWPSTCRPPTTASACTSSCSPARR